jgi:hypothetical protein
MGRAMTEVCPACGQPVLVRHGIRLQRKKADLLDLIEKHTTRGGIDLDRLAWLTYPDDPRSIACQRIRVHINQLNDLLEATDCRVVNRDGRYRVSGT